MVSATSWMAISGVVEISSNLDGREESVAHTPLLAARVVLHLLELGDELLPLLSKTLDATDNQHHV